MDDDLASEHEALLQFLYVAPIGLVQTDIHGAITLINPRSAQLLLPLQKTAGLENLFDALDMVAPELRNLVAGFINSSGTICDNVQFQLSAGLHDKAAAKVLAITLIKIDPCRLMAVIADVTLSARREQQLRQSDAWFNAILTGVSDYAVLPLSRDGTIPYWNQSVGRLTGFDAPSIVGQRYEIFSPKTAISSQRMSDYLHEADESGWSLREDWCLRADGTRFWASFMLSPVEPFGDIVQGRDALSSGPTRNTAAVEQGYALVIRDMSDRRFATAEMLQANFSDYLTGISNRRAFFDSTDLEIKRWYRFPRPLSLLAIDADHFKKINDSYGHAVGDIVLRSLAHSVIKTVRDIDIVARIGGEEFAVLLLGTNQDAAIEVAQRIINGISSQVLQIEGHEIRYTVSIGVCTMNKSITSTTDLLKQADKALYSAKNAGRNQLAVVDDSAGN